MCSVTNPGVVVGVQDMNFFAGDADAVAVVETPVSAFTVYRLPCGMARVCQESTWIRSMRPQMKSERGRRRCRFSGFPTV